MNLVERHAVTAVVIPLLRPGSPPTGTEDTNFLDDIATVRDLHISVHNNTALPFNTGNKASHINIQDIASPTGSPAPDMYLILSAGCVLAGIGRQKVIAIQTTADNFM